MGFMVDNHTLALTLGWPSTINPWLPCSNYNLDLDYTYSPYTIFTHCLPYLSGLLGKYVMLISNKGILQGLINYREFVVPCSTSISADLNRLHHYDY